MGLIRSGMRVFVSGNAATPTPLLKALAARKDELENVELVHLLQMGKTPSPLWRWRGTSEGAPSSWAPPTGRR